MALGGTRETRHTVLSHLLGDLDRTLKSGDVSELATVPTGFRVLDERIGGGIGAGDVMLVAGPPGVGKTIVMLQWARNMAKGGAQVVYVCYEHDEVALMTRLLGLEIGDIDPGHQARNLSEALRRAGQEGHGLDDVMGNDATYREALANLRSYADNLVLVRASGAHTAIEHIDDLIIRHRPQDGRRLVVYLDYLQKIALHPEPPNEAEKVTRLIESVKDLALDHHVPVIAISAVGFEGMDANRIRLHHLRGSSALAFESDVVVVLNEKIKAVSRVHLAYDAHAERKFRQKIIFSIEKNRGGPNLIDLEFAKDFRHFRFDPDGGIVAERLVSERLDEEAV